jgi:hypothetical protein
MPQLEDAKKGSHCCENLKPEICHSIRYSEITDQSSSRMPAADVSSEMPAA